MTSRRRLSALSVTTFCYLTLLGAVLAFAAWPQPGLAQQTLGAMNGTVTDSSDAVVQGVNVKIHSVATNLEVTATNY